MFEYKILTTKNFNFSLSLFEDYVDKSYLNKLSKLNRPLIAVYRDNVLIGAIVFSKHGNALKINILCIHPVYRRKGLGTNLLRLVLSFVEDDFCNQVVVYSTISNIQNSCAYQELLLKNGFQIQTVKANGEVIYTYGKSI